MTPYEERDLILVEASKWQLRAEQAEAALTAARADIAQRDADMRLRENWFNEVSDKWEADLTAARAEVAALKAELETWKRALSDERIKADVREAYGRKR